MERSNSAVKTVFDIHVDGKRGPGRPKMTWKQLTERDCREWKLSAINPHDRHTLRSGVRSAMLAASQLSGRGPTDVDIAPVPARYQKSDYNMIYCSDFIGKKKLNIFLVLVHFCIPSNKGYRK